jgi:5'(3')-deoxyribonucleotidase
MHTHPGSDSNTSASPTRQRIAIDMDEVVADLVEKHVRCYNRDFHDSVTLADLRGKRLREARPEHAQAIRSYLYDPEFFRDLKVIEDAQAVIHELNAYYEIFITTAAMEFPTSFAAKHAWLQEHFSFISELNFVFCGDKSIVHADYLLDDDVRHFPRFIGQGVLFTAPHNLDESGYVRVNNWREARTYFMSRI